MAADSDKPPRSIQPVTIGRHCIGPGERVFIVAAAGVNHNGSVASAIQLVAAATQAVRTGSAAAAALVQTERRIAEALHLQAYDPATALGAVNALRAPKPYEGQRKL